MVACGLKDTGPSITCWVKIPLAAETGKQWLQVLPYHSVIERFQTSLFHTVEYYIAIEKNEVAMQELTRKDGHSLSFKSLKVNGKAGMVAQLLRWYLHK